MAIRIHLAATGTFWFRTICHCPLKSSNRRKRGRQREDDKGGGKIKLLCFDLPALPTLPSLWSWPRALCSFLLQEAGLFYSERVLQYMIHPTIHYILSLCFCFDHPIWNYTFPIFCHVELCRDIMQFLFANHQSTQEDVLFLLSWKWLRSLIKKWWYVSFVSHFQRFWIQVTSSSTKNKSRCKSFRFLNDDDYNNSTFKYFSFQRCWAF